VQLTLPRRFLDGPRSLLTTDLPVIGSFVGLDDDELADLYSYPDRPGRYVRANMVSSLDGAVTIDDRVGGLTTESDQRLLTLLRDLADVVLVGASTVRAEGYTGIRTTTGLQHRRQSAGLTPVTHVAVVSGMADIASDSALLTDTAVPPIIYTSTDAPATAKTALAAAGADVVEIGSGRLDLGAVLADLARRGLARIVCEGGPTLLGALITDGDLNELCVTTNPALVGGSAGRLATATRTTDIAMRCQHILFDQDGTQFARWVRAV
jgi:riboflavin biosynthesis pyrimidine reductase